MSEPSNSQRLTTRDTALLFAVALVLRGLALRPGLPPAPPEALLLGSEPGAPLLMVRLLSVLAGSLAVVLAARAGDRLGGRAGGWAAGGLLALTPFALLHSGWLGSPGVLVLAVAGGLLALLRWRDARRAPDLAALLLWAALAVVGLSWAPLTNVADRSVASPLLEGLRQSAGVAGFLTIALAAVGALLALRGRGAARAVLGATMAMLVLALLREGADRHALGVVLPGLVLLAAFAVARAPGRAGRVALIAALAVALVGGAQAIAVSRGPSPSQAAADWVYRHIENGEPLVVMDPDVELPVYDEETGSKGFHPVALPAPDVSPEEVGVFLDPELVRSFAWLVLRDPPRSAAHARREFQEYFEAEWTAAARFGERAYPATPVTVFERPHLWKPDSVRAKRHAARIEALTATRDTSTALADWILHAGESLRAGGKIHVAGALLAVGSELRPDDAEIRFEIGLTHLLKEERDEAMSWMLDALQIEPQHGAAHYNLGTLLEHENDVNGAETEYRAAILYLDDPTPAHMRLGVLLAERGDLNEARSELQALRRLDPLGEEYRVLEYAIQQAEEGQP